MGMNKASGQDNVKLSLNQDKKEKRKVTRSHYAIEIILVEFLVERELITLKTEARYMKELPVSKKKGKGCIPLNYYAM